MIISHRYRFIFFKTVKTAGTSIEIALSKYCGPNDVVTPVLAQDEELRKQAGGTAPRNYAAPVYDYTLRELARRLRYGPKYTKDRFYNHIDAQKTRELVPKSVWSEYFKFAVCRNPWDLCVSHYYFAYRNGTPPPFSEYLASEMPYRLRGGSMELYSIAGRRVTDRVCRYENLASDLEEVRKQVGLPAPLVLPRAKSDFRTDKRHYRDFVTPEQRDQIARIFRDEIEAYGYEF